MRGGARGNKASKQQIALHMRKLGGVINEILGSRKCFNKTSGTCNGSIVRKSVRELVEQKLLKNTVQARRVSTGSMLTSLSDGSVRGVEKEIMDIKQTMISILETLKAQEKFEYEKFLDMQRREEDDKRKGRESFLERVKKKGIGIVKKGINKVVSPIRNIFSSILGFFTKLFLGRIMIKFLNFFSDPRNIGIVEGISNFNSSEDRSALADVYFFLISSDLLIGI